MRSTPVSHGQTEFLDDANCQRELIINKECNPSYAEYKVQSRRYNVSLSVMSIIHVLDVTNKMNITY